jgi:DNA-binding NarL/FixJ family response regulator
MGTSKGALPIPVDLQVRTLRLGSDEYAVLSFPVVERETPTDDRVNRLASLTEAERQILSSLLQGEPNVVIARSRGTSPSTIANQVAAIYRKLGVRSRRELRARLAPAGRAEA